MPWVGESLVGKKIKEFHIDEERQRITFFVEPKSISWRVGADCCSHTWIESLDDPEALKGIVYKVEEIPMPDLGNVDGKYYQGVEQVQYYGIKVTTENGRCVIDFRNDSNGYYGGWMFDEAEK